MNNQISEYLQQAINTINDYKRQCLKLYIDLSINFEELCTQAFHKDENKD
jgi:hypothetical protein